MKMVVTFPVTDLEAFLPTHGHISEENERG